jgi:hypothetical protein
MASDETVRVALLGAGERGQLMFGLFAKKYPQLFKYVAVAEPNDERRRRFEQDFEIPRENVFSDWRDLLAKPQLADALYSHLLCFAADEARINGTIVDMTEFRDRAERDADAL